MYPKGNRRTSLNRDYGFGGYFLHYHTKEGRYKRISQSKVKKVVAGKRFYLNIKIGNIYGAKRLHEVILTSDKYLLIQYYEDQFYFLYITDLKTKKFIEKKIIISRRRFRKRILPYFKECDQFIKKVESNLTYSDMFFEISNMKCLK